MSPSLYKCATPGVSLYSRTFFTIARPADGAVPTGTQSVMTVSPSACP
jgi:hypothetical protein